MWQQLQSDLADHAFTVIAVAEESRGADSARPWIEAAAPTYPALIDVEHLVAARYAMVNVPQAVWIDEAGRIVRPAETAGSTDHFRRMDLATRTMAPSDQAARLAARQFYMDAVRDWVRTGRVPPAGPGPTVTPAIAEADARFRLGLHLHAAGRADEAASHFAEASRLHPDSWNLWRQAADLGAVGDASGAAFWDRVRALGDRPYYPPPDLPGFPKA